MDSDSEIRPVRPMNTLKKTNFNTTIILGTLLHFILVLFTWLKKFRVCRKSKERVFVCFSFKVFHFPPSSSHDIYIVELTFRSKS